MLNVVGSQYYYDWDYANVKMYTGEIAYNKRLRYNGLLNEMIWMMPEDNIQVKLDKSRIKEVYLLNYHVLFRNMPIASENNYLKSDNDSSIFAEVLLENKISMYAYRHVVSFSSEIHHSTNNEYVFDHITNGLVYYIKLPDQQSYIKIYKIKKKTLINLFPTRKSEVRKLLRENNVSISSEADFVKGLIVVGKAFYK